MLATLQPGSSNERKKDPISQKRMGSYYLLGLEKMSKKSDDIGGERIKTLRTGKLGLIEENSFLNTVLEKVGEGLCVCHEIKEFPFVQFTVWNARMTEITGYTIEEINRLGWYQSVYPDPEIQARAIDRMGKMRQGLDIKEEEWEITRKDGKKRMLLITTSLLVSSDGRIHALALMRDNTERVRIGEDLKRTRQEWEDIFQSIGHLAMILDLNHGISKANRATLTATGAKEETELIGKKCYEIFHRTQEPPVGCPMEKMLGSKNFEALEMEMEALDRTFMVSCTPVLDPKGILQKVIHMAVDITDRKRTEDTLRQSQNKILSIFQAAPVGIGMVINRIIKEANDRLCEMTGYTQEELLDMDARMLYPTEDDFLFVGREKYSQIAEKGIGTVETRWRRKSGEVLDVLLSSSPLDPEELSKGVTFTALNISDRKIADESLRLSEEKLSKAFRASPDWMTISTLSEGRYIEVNDAFVELTGFSREEALGHTTVELGIWVDPNERNRAMEIIRKEGFLK
ncbi:MAG: hypothetical protein C0407_13025, partial [Desulfobacca sp.]|nr:hypothetical protein [Desulfobacca sp.]